MGPQQIQFAAADQSTLIILISAVAWCVAVTCTKGPIFLLKSKRFFCLQHLFKEFFLSFPFETQLQMDDKKSQKISAFWALGEI